MSVAVAVVVAGVLIFVLMFSVVYYRRRASSHGIFELVDVSPVALAAPGIASPSVVGNRATPSPLRGSDPPRAQRTTGSLLSPTKEGLRS